MIATTEFQTRGGDLAETFQDQMRDHGRKFLGDCDGDQLALNLTMLCMYGLIHASLRKNPDRPAPVIRAIALTLGELVGQQDPATAQAIMEVISLSINDGVARAQAEFRAKSRA